MKIFFWVTYIMSVLFLSAFFCALWSYAEEIKPVGAKNNNSTIEKIFARLKLFGLILFPVINQILALLLLFNAESVMKMSKRKIMDEVSEWGI